MLNNRVSWVLSPPSNHVARDGERKGKVVNYIILPFIHRDCLPFQVLMTIFETKVLFPNAKQVTLY